MGRLRRAVATGTVIAAVLCDSVASAGWAVAFGVLSLPRYVNRYRRPDPQEHLPLWFREP